MTDLPAEVEAVMSEAVEAAARGMLDAGHSIHLWDESWDELAKYQRKELRSAANTALTAALPVLLAAHRDHLAGEAGENPYEQFALADPDDGDYPLQVVAWKQGAAAGVAAERARVREAVTKAHDRTIRECAEALREKKCPQPWDADHAPFDHAADFLERTMLDGEGSGDE